MASSLRDRGPNYTARAPGARLVLRRGRRLPGPRRTWSVSVTRPIPWPARAGRCSLGRACRSYRGRDRPAPCREGPRRAPDHRRGRRPRPDRLRRGRARALRRGAARPARPGRPPQGKHLWMELDRPPFPALPLRHDGLLRDLPRRGRAPAVLEARDRRGGRDAARDDRPRRLGVSACAAPGERGPLAVWATTSWKGCRRRASSRPCSPAGADRRRRCCSTSRSSPASGTGSRTRRSTRRRSTRAGPRRRCRRSRWRASARACTRSCAAP